MAMAECASTLCVSVAACSPTREHAGRGEKMATEISACYHPRKRSVRVYTMLVESPGMIAYKKNIYIKCNFLTLKGSATASVV